jgi:heavy metal translocating P-type ATPase
MKQQYDVMGMTCSACQAAVERAVHKVPGTDNVQVNLLTGKLHVEADETISDQIIAAVEKAGYTASSTSREKTAPSVQKAEENQFKKEAKELKKRLLWSLAFMLPLMYIAMGHMVGAPLPAGLTGTENHANFALTQFLLTIPVLFINRGYFIRGFKSLYHRAPNMDSLIAVGSGAAVLYGIYALYRINTAMAAGDWETVHAMGMQLYFESSVMILTLITLGKFLEARAKSRTTDSLTKLMDLAPKTARVVRDDTEIVVAAEDLKAGAWIRIRPGERLPVDGVVVAGSSSVDTSAITGESIPVLVEKEDKVTSGTVNLTGTIDFRVTQVGSDTTLAQIVRLVEEANATKAPIAKLADRISGIFVPIVLVIALLTFTIWMLAGSGLEFSLTNAISVLVISCPCALGLATPVAIMVGTGKGAGEGILIKSAESLEVLHDVDTVLLDKTGTITRGEPVVTDVVTTGDISEKEFLTIAATLESASEHPLSRAILRHAKQQGIQAGIAEDFQAVSGFGIEGRIDGTHYLAGNRRFLTKRQIKGLESLDILDTWAEEGKTPMLFSDPERVIGMMAVQDPIKKSSVEAIRALHEAGMEVMMLTGDNEKTAQAIAKEAGLDRVFAQVLPADKEEKVRELQESKKKVAMVGDGINDAPALARADVGVAIGAGTDIAMESADIVLVRSALTDLVAAIDLSRATIRNIKQNLFWAFFYNTLGIPIAAGLLYKSTGILMNPMLAAGAMSVSSVFVVTNALRLNRFQKRSFASDVSQSQAEEDTVTENRIQEGIMERTLHVEGMTCSHCEARVKKVLEAVEGVQKVEVDLEAHTARVQGESLEDTQLTAVVEDAGYEVKEIV